MFEFNSKNIPFYIFSAGVLFTISYLGTRMRSNMVTSKRTDDYEMVKKYLLNDSPLYGYNKPKLWIHSKYEINARNWHDFSSRNSTDLNQPYLLLTIKSIIEHCSDDFNICLIDDETFSKLIPTWDTDLSTIAEPMKSKLRNIGMMELIYYYGGMCIPNSFLCLRNLLPLYNESIVPLCSENINRTVNLEKSKNGPTYLPSIDIISAPKNNDVILELVEYLKQIARNPHFTSEYDFNGSVSYFLIDKIRNNQMSTIHPSLIGLKTQSGKPITIENLVEEGYLDLNSSAYGILIPREEFLRRLHYQWFPVLQINEILKSNMAITKYFILSDMESKSIYNRTTEVRSAITI
jgi:hypothetical protein